MMVPLSSRPAVSLAQSARQPPRQAGPQDAPSGDLAKAAQQFEAIFLRQMLAAARKADFGGEESLLGGQGLTTFRQMQDERFATIAAESGALGIGRMIADRLQADMALPPARSLAPSLAPSPAPAAAQAFGGKE